jgi:hypothetical protein
LARQKSGVRRRFWVIFSPKKGFIEDGLKNVVFLVIFSSFWTIFRLFGPSAGLSGKRVFLGGHFWGRFTVFCRFSDNLGFRAVFGGDILTVFAVFSSFLVLFGAHFSVEFLHFHGFSRVFGLEWFL